MSGAAGAQDCVLAVDVGGTTMKGALVDAEATVRERRSFDTPVADGTEAVVNRIGYAFEQLATLAPGHGLNPPSAAGLVVPGVVDEANGVGVIASNVPFADTPLAAPIGERLGIPVRVGHDVRAGGLAESVLGAAAGSANVLFLPLGTGIAAACIVDGRVLAADGFAGEIGHVVIDPDGESCNCGNRGCLERVASASAVARRYTAASGQQVDGAERVAELVRAADPVAVGVWDETVDALVRALRMALTLLGSEVVIVGGGLGEAGDLLLDPLRERLAKALTFQRKPELRQAVLGDQAGCLGAALLALGVGVESSDGSRQASAP